MIDLNNFISHVRNPQKRTVIMGIVNVTPDSFSDGGDFFSPELAIDHALKLVKDGADVIDIGGESTRPGSDPVSLEEERKRVLPVIEGIRSHSDILISIDTYKSGVAEAALRTGANIVNDISGLQFDPNMTPLIAESGVPIIMMHIKGTAKDMQIDPVYYDLLAEITDYFQHRIDAARTNGIRDEQMILDPGIGFGKQWRDNYTLIRELDTLIDLGFPILMGPSRKSFIGQLLDLPVSEREEGTAAAVTACILKGARIIRVHDVEAMQRVITVADAIRGVFPDD